MLNELESTAYHEAGHAVACYVLRRGFRYVTVVPTEEFLGHLKATRWHFRFDPYEEVTSGVRARIDREILIDFAGQIAEEKVRGTFNEVGASGDNQSVMDLALYLTGGDVDEAELYLNWLYYRACRLLEDPLNWGAVKHLAEELIRKPTVSGGRARTIIREAILQKARVGQETID